MNRSQRKRNLEFLRAIRDGKKIIKPWEGRFICWTLDSQGNYRYQDHIVPPDQIDQFIETMGGTNVIWQADNNSMPVGTDPDERIERSLGQKIKEIISDIFSPEPKQVKAETPREKFLPNSQPITQTTFQGGVQSQTLLNVAGGGAGEWEMDQSYLVAGYEQLKQLRL